MQVCLCVSQTDIRLSTFGVHDSVFWPEGALKWQLFKIWMAVKCWNSLDSYFGLAGLLSRSAVLHDQRHVGSQAGKTAHGISTYASSVYGFSPRHRRGTVILGF